MLEWLVRWSHRRLRRQHDRTNGHRFDLLFPRLGRMRQTPLALFCRCGSALMLFSHIEVTWPEVTLREDPRVTLEDRLAGQH